MGNIYNMSNNMYNMLFSAHFLIDKYNIQYYVQNAKK
jgi:hypothetical protein